MSISSEGSAEDTGSRRPARRYLRPLVGLLLPVGLAAFWELAVYFGWSNGRLVPPPSVIYQ
ncbi:MAG TPA: ABC transporter permease, partial [Xanthobacteraceae bacterium]|nr:ABC transporter permease [Xanthobacteraceae bacterium]